MYICGTPHSHRSRAVPRSHGHSSGQSSLLISASDFLPWVSCPGSPALRASDPLYQTIGHDMSRTSNILRLPTFASASVQLFKAVLPPRFLDRFCCDARGSDWLWYGQHTFFFRECNAPSLNKYVRGSSRFLYKTIASPTCLNISTYRASFVLTSGIVPGLTQHGIAKDTIGHILKDIYEDISARQM